MNWFLLLKTVHVLSAIVALGTNVTYAVWMSLGASEPAHNVFALRGVERLEQRVSNPAYGLLLVTGVIMALRQYSFSNTWILIGLAGFIVAAGVSTAVFAPALRRQIAAAETDGSSSETSSRAATTRAVGLFLIVLIAAIVVVMVFKPQ